MLSFPVSKKDVPRQAEGVKTTHLPVKIPTPPSADKYQGEKTVKGESVVVNQRVKSESRAWIESWEFEGRPREPSLV